MLKSQVIEVPGAASFAEFPVVQHPGTVVWCNFDLARELGFDVPRANQMTPELHDQLIASLSLRALKPKENVDFMQRAARQSLASHRAAKPRRRVPDATTIDALYCSTLYEDLNRAIDEYKSTGRPEIIQDAIDTRVARSLRSVDRLLVTQIKERLTKRQLELCLFVRSVEKQLRK